MKQASNNIDRATFLQNLRTSKLLTSQQFRLVADKLKDVESPRELAKALVSWKLITKFQAKMLLSGRNYTFYLGPYRILDLLGRGGMGHVFKAMHQTMNRIVALKVLSPQVVKTERAQQLFQREVQAAARLNHPNIVMAYDANESRGKHYLAMEYVDGPNLEQYVREHGPLPTGLASEIIFQAANGLEHAHERGMVHRDIKPANLLFRHEQGKTIEVKILDFGLARLCTPALATAGGGEKTIATKENTVMGTPDFLSPEQSRDLDVDIRADLYSLGCTFYFLLTGQVPFPGGSILDKLLRHSTELPADVAELRPGVPMEVVEIVRKLMAKEPAERYQSPNDLMDALSPYAAPSVMDWPIAPLVDKSGSDEHPALQPGQVDTEPKAQSTTQISDHESVLEWVDTHSKTRRRVRYAVAAIVLLGVMALGVGGLLIWSLVGGH